jgi:hypothetical protein
MIVKLAGKQIYKKCVVVLICLLMFGNLAHRAVRCFGPDECVSIELRPADFCDECLCVPVQPSPKSCGQCIDIPIYTGLAKITRVSKQLNSTFSASAINVIVPGNKFNLSAYNSASSAFDAASYFAPLRTVILVV